MKNKILPGVVLSLALSLGVQSVSAQKIREQKTVTGNYNDTATIAPTIARIKSLKMPAGFSIAKFAEIENPRMLAVAPDGTVYVSQREPGTLTTVGMYQRKPDVRNIQEVLPPRGK